MPEGFELGGCAEPGTHELDFVEDPEAVIVQQGEIERPAKAAHGIASVERTGKELILCADDHHVPVRCAVPVLIDTAAHKHMNGRSFLQYPFFLQPYAPSAYEFRRLFHKHAHGQAPHKAARSAVITCGPLVLPCEIDGGSLAQPGGDVQQVGPLAEGQSLLVGVGLVPQNGSVKGRNVRWHKALSCYRENLKLLLL